jgi:hypothetical protein
MITLEIEGISVEGFRTPPKRVDLPVYYVLYNIKGVPFRYFTRFQDNWSQVSETQVLARSLIIPLDPITALIKQLATPEELGMGGIEALVSLMKPV